MSSSSARLSRSRSLSPSRLATDSDAATHTDTDADTDTRPMSRHSSTSASPSCVSASASASASIAPLPVSASASSAVPSHHVIHHSHPHQDVSTTCDSNGDDDPDDANDVDIECNANVNANGIDTDDGIDRNYVREQLRLRDQLVTEDKCDSGMDRAALLDQLSMAERQCQRRCRLVGEDEDETTAATGLNKAELASTMVVTRQWTGEDEEKVPKRDEPTAHNTTSSSSSCSSATGGNVHVTSSNAPVCSAQSSPVHGGSVRNSSASVGSSFPCCLVSPHPSPSSSSSSSSSILLIAGVDLSFVDGTADACAALVVCHFPSMRVVYERYEWVTLKEEYRPGFLAFRECPPLAGLLRELRHTHPHLYPSVILVDGNGLLHPRSMGLASHLGVVLDTPTIGVAKTMITHDGMDKRTVTLRAKEVLRHGGDYFLLRGVSGRVWGACLRSNGESTNPIYVSIGHRVSLLTSVRLVHACCQHRVPTPIRLADLGSRHKIRQTQQNKTDKTRTTRPDNASKAHG